MCHGLRACVRIHLISRCVAALVCWIIAVAAHEAIAQSTRAAGAGAPPVVPPRSTLRIGDTKRTTSTSTTPGGTASSTPSNAASEATSSTGSYSVGNGGGSQLQIRVPTPSGPTTPAHAPTSPPIVATPATLPTESPYDAPSQLRPSTQPASAPPQPTVSSLPTSADPVRGTPTLAPPKPTALNPATSRPANANPPIEKEELPPIAPFAVAPAVVNPKRENPQPTYQVPTTPTVAPAVRGPAFTASTAPLTTPSLSTTTPAPMAQSPASSLPPIQPPLEPTVSAAPARTRNSPTATSPTATAPPTEASVPSAPMPILPPIAAANPTPTQATTQAPSTFGAPPPEPVVFPPTRTLTRTPAASSPAATPPGAPAIVPLSEPAAVSGSTAAADPVVGGALPKLEPVDFNGVLLGESTVDEVVKAWGQPVRRSGAGNDLRLNYKIEPFDSIDVTFFDSKAEAIVIELGEKFPPPEIIRELSLNEADAVTVEDAAGSPLGIVFPERGVSLRYEPAETGPLVATIGLDRISARPFVLRAEKRIERSYGAALIDLAIAVDLDPKNSRAHWLRAKLLHKTGRTHAALEAIEAALKIDPKAADYLLTRAEFLADEGLAEAARADNDTVLEGTKSLPLYQARAWCQRGDLLAGGAKPDFSEAIDAHTRAVRLAEPLTTDKNRMLRRGAKRILVEAHLAIAQDVAWGEWQSKEATVERWLKKAESLALEGKSSGDLGSDVLMDVYIAAAQASVGIQGKGEPLAWAEGLKRTAEEMLAECRDPLRRKQIQFDAGLGLYDALQALHARGDIDNALKYGTEAVEWIQQGRVGRDESPIDAYRFGRLYFRIGSLYAVKRNDHATAVEWFARAAPLLERPLSDGAAADRGRQGETLVSMGISYWATGNRERALQLTNVGASYMQQAVNDGTLAAPAMGVAYSNLATMHKQLGDETTSKRFVEMATRVEAPADGVLRR